MGATWRKASDAGQEFEALPNADIDRAVDQGIGHLAIHTRDLMRERGGVIPLLKAGR
jgi:hypothetical protein